MLLRGSGDDDDVVANVPLIGDVKDPSELQRNVEDGCVRLQQTYVNGKFWGPG